MRFSNRLFIRFGVTFLTISALFSSCKKDDPTPPECDALWGRYTNPRGVISVSGGNLSLEVPDSLFGYEEFSVFQDSLRGDFTVEANFTDLRTGILMEGAYLYLTVITSDTGDVQAGIAGIGTYNAPGYGLQSMAGVFSGMGGQVARDLLPTTASAGALSISRTGDSLTISSSTSEGTASVTSAPFNGKAARLLLRFGSNYGPLAGPVGVKVTDFIVTGGGGQVKTDVFDCNSLK